MGNYDPGIDLALQGNPHQNRESIDHVLDNPQQT